jgi:MraZ protein
VGTSFLGKFDHALDSKGRLAVPARFRDGLAAGSVLTRGSDHCLIIYPQTAWQALRTSIAELPMSDANARAFRRFLFAEASELELDGQGRILLSASQRAHADIDRSAVIVGMDSTIEIWSDSRWTAIEMELNDSSGELLDQLRTLI